MNATEDAAARGGPPEAGEAGIRSRIPSLDVLRGVAVLGILLINISVFGLPPGAYVVASNTEILPAVDFYLWTANEIFVEGTMRALFSMLFGASMLLMTGFSPNGRAPRSPSPHALDQYALRSLWLIAFGLIHGYILLWPYDILYAYGLLGLLLLPFRLLPVRKLILGGILMLAIAALLAGMKDPGGKGDYSLHELFNPAVAMEVRAPLPEGFSDVTPPDDEVRLGFAAAEAEDAIHTRRSGYRDNFLDMAEVTADRQSRGFYRSSVFDIGGMMLLGMALLKAGVLTGQRSRRFYWIMLVTGYGIGIVVNGAEAWASIMSPEDSAKLIYWSEVTYDLGRLPMAIGHLGALMLLMKTRWFETIGRMLALAGRLALTNYVMQTVICNTLFLGVGFGLYGKFSLSGLMAIAIVIGVAQIAFSALWLHNFRMGPLEWALRSLVRHSPQPMRRRGPVTVSVAGGSAGT